MPGPIRKRDEERVRRNVDEIPTEKVSVPGTVKAPELDLGVSELHPMVRDYYQSFIDSGQSRYFEPSDWQHARLAMLTLNQMLTNRNKEGQLVAISAMKLQVLNQMLATLLSTEGERRRVRMEIERVPVATADTGTTAEDQFKRWMESQ